jgi:hypothetical protein
VALVDEQNSGMAFSSLVGAASWVNWPITNHLPLAEHFGKNFSILLHFE